MALRWTSKAHSDLVRLYEFLQPVNGVAALRAVRALAAGVRRIPLHPRLGLRLERYAPREVRRVLIGVYEIRYEIQGTEVVVLRIFHTREDR